MGHSIVFVLRLSNNGVFFSFNIFFYWKSQQYFWCARNIKANYAKTVSARYTKYVIVNLNWNLNFGLNNMRKTINLTNYWSIKSFSTSVKVLAFSCLFCLAWSYIPSFLLFKNPNFLKRCWKVWRFIIKFKAYKACK